MANKKLAVISLFFCLVGFFLTLAAFYSDNWVNFDFGTDEIEFGLLRQTDDSIGDTVIPTWYCISVYYCEAHDVYEGQELFENTAEAWCEIGTGFWRGALFYYTCNMVSFVFLCKCILSSVSILLDHDPGKRILMIIYAIMFPIMSIIGFTGWWANNSNVKYDGQCDYDDYTEGLAEGDRWEMCAGPGATVSIFAFVFIILAGVVAVLNALKQIDTREIPLVQDGSIFCLNIKVHFIIIYIFLLLILVQSLTTPMIRDWVNFNITNSQPPLVLDIDFKGSLFAVDEINGIYQGQIIEMERSGWDCLGKRACDVDSDGTYCKTFEPLMDAGRLYLNLEITVFGLLMMWHNFLANSIVFSREWGIPLINYILPHLAWILHLAATICWSVVSKVKFEMGDCDNTDIDADEKLDVCIKAGPIIAIVQLVLQVIFAFYFSLVYYERGQRVIPAPLSSIDQETTRNNENEPKSPSSFAKLQPDNCTTISPVLIVDDAKSAIALYSQAFDGKLNEQIEENGTILSAEIQIGDCYIIVKDVSSSDNTISPKVQRCTTGEVHICVENSITMYTKCLELGFAKRIVPSEKLIAYEQYHLECPFGHMFTFRTQPYSTAPFRKLNTCIVVKDTATALNLYQQVFSCSLGEQIKHKGKVAYCEMIIGSNVICLADEVPDDEVKSPQSLGNTSFEVMLSLPDFNDQYQTCVDCGFKTIQSPHTLSQEKRCATLEDPFGHLWHLQTKLHQLSVKDRMKNLENL